MKPVSDKYRKICLIRLSAIGDAVHALALANGLKYGFPNAHLTWIIQHLPHELVKHQSAVDRFVLFDKKQGLRGISAIRKQLKSERFDIILVPQVSFKAGLIAKSLRSRIKLGFNLHRSRELHYLFTNRHIPAHPIQHVQDQFLEFLKYMGITDYKPVWQFHFTEEELLWQRKFFSGFKRPVAAIVAASSNPEKDWTPEGYAAAADYLYTRWNCAPVIIGGPSAYEKTLADKIVTHSSCPLAVALEKPLRHTLLQLAGSALVISPDTGPLHMAVALNVPSIALYGYSNPRRCGPYRRFHDLLVDRFNDPKDPITRKTKPGVMKTISVEEVFARIDHAMTTYLHDTQPAV